MVRLSKIRLEKRILEKIYELFFEAVGKNYNKQTFLKVISDVLSPDERIMISKRIAIYYMLLKDVDVMVISEALRVTRTTVAKYKFLLDKSEGILPSLKKGLRNEKMTLLLESFLNEIPKGLYVNKWRQEYIRQDIKSRKHSI